MLFGSKQDCGEFDRRDLLRGAAGLALAQLAMPAALLADNPDCSPAFNAEEFLRAFPAAADIPGIAEVELVNHPGATKVLCVFEQLHYVDNLKQRDVPLVENAQTNLLRAYRSLKGNPQIAFNHLFVEGVYHDAPDEIIAIKRRQLLESTQYLRDQGDITRTGTIDVNTMPGFLSNLDPFTKRLEFISTLGWIGAAEFLGFQGGITVLGAENKEYYLKTFELEKSGTQDEVDHYLYDMRENALIGYAAASDRDVCYSVYGCGHNFKDNVAQYNTNSATPFALIVLRPQAVINYNNRSALPVPPPPQPMRNFMDLPF